MKSNRKRWAPTLRWVGLLASITSGACSNESSVVEPPRVGGGPVSAGAGARPDAARNSAPADDEIRVAMPGADASRAEAPALSRDGGGRTDGTPPVTPPPERGIRFVPPRGFYDVALSVAITTDVPGSTIRYTLDGTKPTATTGMTYAGSIPIKGTSVLRAAAFTPDGSTSYVDTHTYIFVNDVIRQSPDGMAPPGWPTSWGKNTVNYGMDPRVVDDPRYSGTIKADLKAIPTMSIVMPLPDLFDPAKGIYANASNDGMLWERPTSLELIRPDGKPGFQINAGIRIRGGASRTSGNAKHSFRFFFRKLYGDGKLRYPVFGPTGAAEFDKFDVRSAQDDSWSLGGDAKAIYIRDQFSRETHLAMGYQGERGDPYHLYINGIYWGLFETNERPEASFAMSYFGGAEENYDIVKVDAPKGYVLYATDGDLMAWTRLYDMLKVGPWDDALFQKVQARSPDGAPNAAIEKLIEVDDLIDYMLLVAYTGNLDAPTTLDSKSPNNFYGIRDRKGSAGFKFIAHDSETSLSLYGNGLNDNRLGPWPAGDAAVNKSNPGWFYFKLQGSPAFRRRIADRVQKHFFNGGAFTAEVAIPRFTALKNEIDRAIVPESARWGDVKKPVKPLTRDDTWLPAVNQLLTNYFPMRTAVVIKQLQAKGLYPATVPAAP